jgi:hypothetical protein
MTNERKLTFWFALPEMTPELKASTLAELDHIIAETQAYVEGQLRFMKLFFPPVTLTKEIT